MIEPVDKTFVSTPLRATQPDASLCFVTACDKNDLYFSLICELIESLRASKAYGRIPLFVIDGGMESAQREYLYRNCLIAGAISPDPVLAAHGWTFCPRTKAFAATVARAYIPHLFPGYRYYFYVDGDTWLHDEGAVGRYLNLATRQSVGASRVEEECFWGSVGCRPEIICDDLWDEPMFRAQHYVCNGIFCIDSFTDMFSRLQDAVERNRARGVQFFTDQSSFNVVYSTRTTLNFSDNFLLNRKLPWINQQNQLVDPVTGRQLGFVHLSGPSKRRLRRARALLKCCDGGHIPVPLRYRGWSNWFSSSS